MRPLQRSFPQSVPSTDGGSAARLSVRLSRLIYPLAYALEMVLWLTRGHYLGAGVRVLGLPGYLFGVAAYGLGSLLVMLLWRPDFRRLVFGSVAVTLPGFLLYIFLPVGMPRFWIALPAFAGLGGCVTAARCGYAFACNQTERLFGMFLILLGAFLIREVDADGTNNVLTLYILPVALLLGMCVCLLMFREKDFAVRQTTEKRDTRALSWAVAYFMVYFTVDGYHWDLFSDVPGRDRRWHLVAVLVSSVLFFVLLRLKRGVWHVWNLTFVAAAAMGVLAVLPGTAGNSVPLQLAGGVALIGWPAAILTLAAAQSYFADYRLLKITTVAFVLGSPLLNFSDELLLYFVPKAVPVVTMLVTLLPVLALAVLAPFSFRDLFSAPWLGDLNARQAEDLRRGKPPEDPFAPFALTPRQREVASLLLEAKTRRQIAGELGLSESTVKTHTTELYKKLGINSRVALFRLFPPALPSPGDTKNHGGPDGTL